jgi:hypothetical protein
MVKDKVNHRTKKKSRGCVPAYLTVYLALVMTVILSLCLALIEGTRQNAIFMEAECVTDIGLNSVLAEYNRELLAQYNLFAVDSSYGTSRPLTENTEKHLKEYINKNLSAEDVLLDWLLYRDFLGMSLENVDMTKVSFMTDDNGRVFRTRAVEAVQDDMNLDLFQELQSWMQVVESENLTERDIAAEKSKLDQQLKDYDGQTKQISETEWITIEVKNPTAALEKKRKEGILKWAVQNPESLSNKTLSTENLISARLAAGRVNQGNMEISETSAIEETLERFLFQEYLLRYMGYYGAESDEDALTYQIEYLIAGKENDLDNLRSVANTIFGIREVANTVYIASDEEKCAIAEALGSLLASAMTIPEASGLLKWILLFGWAYAESTYDMKCLMAGERVPLMKDSQTWHYGLQNALALGDVTSDESSEGLSYADYLRILMSLQKEDTLTARAMDMVEADIRQTAGNEAFRLDGCMDCVEACVEIESVYGYSCEITRKKGYSTQ